MSLIQNCLGVLQNKFLPNKNINLILFLKIAFSSQFLLFSTLDAKSLFNSEDKTDQVAFLEFLFGTSIQKQAKDTVNEKYTPETFDAAHYVEDFHANRLLMLSILKIVKNYYVDADRVDHRDLVIGTLANLSEDSLIHLSQNAENVEFQISNTLLSFAVPNELSEIAAVDLLMNIAGFLNMHESRQQKTALVQSGRREGVELVLDQMLSMLDAHSGMLSVDAYQELKQGTEGAFGGLGVLVGIRNKLLTVIRPLPRSPAMRVGIAEKDIILSIDGNKTFGFGIDDLVQYMRGAPGSEVELRILRENALYPRTLKLQREIIQVDSVEVKPIKSAPDVLHITIDSFTSRTSQEVYQAIKNFRRFNKGQLGGLVLDLRSNPGGLLDQAIQVADLFIEDGVIVMTKGRREEIEKAGIGFDPVDYPIVVLINSDSASASEIVAGALQDHARAVVIGQPSFGKGSVQTIFELPGSRALKLTIARYYTPLGRSIQNTGILPDIWLQPVVQLEKNINLLGSNHYKNEKLLRHKLNAMQYRDASENPFKIQPTFKGYYLIENSEGFEAQKVDRELELASLLIKSVNEAYGLALPKAFQRSAHWVALASNILESKINGFSSEAQNWLNKNYGIDWTINRSNSNLNPELQVAAVNGENEEHTPGSNYSLKIQLTNNSAVDLDRTSVFLITENLWFLTREVLVGKIKAFEKRTIDIPIEIPSDWPAGEFEIKLLSALDSEPLSGKDVRTSLRVVSRKSPEIELANYILTGESILRNNVLEPTETAFLNIELSNISAISADKLKLKLVNLSGTQIELHQSEFTLDALDSKERKTLSIPIKANRNLFSNNIELGLVVESSKLKEDYLKILEVVAQPRLTIGGTENELLGH
ncbi:MAG: PDZ domain-containing protein [Oligoflexales bacterium]|nr:PDZ domain-containing protein [Oligoflexales bacterium]